MSADGGATFDWAGAERVFRLGFGQIAELQRRLTVYATDQDGNLLLNKHGNAAVAYSGAIQRVFERLTDGGWLQDDIVETLRMGLIGGGMQPGAAKRIISEHCRPPYEKEITVAAARVLLAVLIGDPGDPIPKSEAVKTTTDTTTAPVESPSAASTETVPQ